MPRILTVDTNTWVSAFITQRGHAARLKQHWHAGRFAVVTCAELLTELAEVLARARLQSKYKYSLEEAAAYLHSITKLAQLIPVTGTLNLCRDPDDNILIETAIAGHATHVVSRDEDIVRDIQIVRYLSEHGVQAITINRFLVELDAPFNRHESQKEH
jgi:putative PIN family toxin of toxin-antitoxin system